MTAKWSGQASNATAGNRLLNVSMCATQLSTGDLVQLVWDPSQVATANLYLEVVTSHTSPSVVGYLNTDAFDISAGAPQSMALCRDASDNIYVFGRVASATVSGNQILAQAFVKGSGLSWTQMAYGFATFATNVAKPMGLSAVWCNTGGGPGGSGHVLVIWTDTTGTSHAQIIRASLMLTGVPLLAGTTNYIMPSFLQNFGQGGVYPTAAGSNIDMDAAGVGTPSGLALNINGGNSGASSVSVGAWGVSASGVLTGAGALVGLTGGPVQGVTAPTKVQLVNYANNRWAAVYPSFANLGQLTITGLTGSGLAASTQALSSVDSGTPTNFPVTMGANLSWGAIAGPANSNTVWIYGWSTGTNTTMLRLPVVFTATGVPSIIPANIVTDDTSVGAATNSSIRVVDDVVDFQHADWQAYNHTVAPIYSLLGDYSALPSGPVPVTLISPVNNDSIPKTGTYTWLYNPAFPGDTQATYYFRRQLQPGGVYHWWNGTDFSSVVEVANTSVNNFVSFASFGAQWTAGSIYSWSIDVTGTSGIRAGYCSPQFVGIAHAAPSNPTLTAVWDAVMNSTMLSLHSTDSTGVNGSIEYSDDGVTWFFVRNAAQLTTYPSTAAVVDYEMDPGVRTYRARSWTTAPFGYSAYVTQTVTAYVIEHRLGDPTVQSPSGWMPIHVMATTFATHFSESITFHTLLGRTRPLGISDTLTGEDGTCQLWTRTDAEESQFLSLVLGQKTLMLIAPEGKSWYIRLDSPRDVARPTPGSTDRLRYHTMTWRQVDRP